MKAFDKAKVPKKKNKKKWWIVHTKRNSYHIIALPLIPFCELYDKARDYASSRRVWSDTKAVTVLNAVLPHLLEWSEEDQAFYYCMDWGESALWKFAPRRYRKWTRKFKYKLHQFILDKYEHPQYKKIIENECYECWVKFIEK